MTSSAPARPVSSVPATGLRVLAALAVDLGVLLLGAALLALAVLGRAADLGVLLALLLLACLAVEILGLLRDGRTLGLRLLGVRQVAVGDNAPLGVARLLQASWFADLRRGRDPVLPLAPATPTAYPSAAPADAPAAPASRAPWAGSVLRIDDRTSWAIGTGVVLGRSPTAGPGQRAIVIADLGRVLSKTHLEIRVDAAGRLSAVDRHSRNGSVLRGADGREAPLPPEIPVELQPGDALLIGGHTITLPRAGEAG